MEGGKISDFNKLGGWIFVLWRVEFFKIGKRNFTFIREIRVRLDFMRTIYTRVRLQLDFQVAHHNCKTNVIDKKNKVATLIKCAT